MLQPLIKRTRDFGRRIPLSAGGGSLALSLKLLLKSMNVRLTYYDRTSDPARPEYSEHCVFVFWHETPVVLLPMWGECPVTLLVSQHRDAEWLNQIANSLGFNCVRGSSTRGGSAAIRQLKQHGKRSSFAITPDGPQGPRHHMAMGPIFLASRLQMPIVPVGVGYQDPWRMNTWDRFIVPKPFSRARILFGPKIRLRSRLKRNEMEHARLGIQRLLVDLTGQADRWANEGYRLAGQTRFVRTRRGREFTFDTPNQPHLQRFDQADWSAPKPSFEPPAQLLKAS